MGGYPAPWAARCAARGTCAPVVQTSRVECDLVVCEYLGEVDLRFLRRLHPRAPRRELLGPRAAHRGRRSLVGAEDGHVALDHGGSRARRHVEELAPPVMTMPAPAAEEEELRAAVAAMREQLWEEEVALRGMRDEHHALESQLGAHTARRLDLHARLRRIEQGETHRQSATKLLAVHGTIARQLNELAEVIAQLRDADQCKLKRAEAEVAALAKVLSRQQQLAHDAQGQLLELTRRAGKVGASSRVSTSSDQQTELELRAALIEAEAGRASAAARADHLQDQLQLLDAGGARAKLLPRLQLEADGSEQAPLASKPAHIIIPSDGQSPL